MHRPPVGREKSQRAAPRRLPQRSVAAPQRAARSTAPPGTCAPPHHITHSHRTRPPRLETAVPRYTLVNQHNTQHVRRGAATRDRREQNRPRADLGSLYISISLGRHRGPCTSERTAFSVGSLGVLCSAPSERNAYRGTERSSARAILASCESLAGHSRPAAGLGARRCGISCRLECKCGRARRRQRRVPSERARARARSRHHIRQHRVREHQKTAREWRRRTIRNTTRQDIEHKTSAARAQVAHASGRPRRRGHAGTVSPYEYRSTDGSRKTFRGTGHSKIHDSPLCARTHPQRAAGCVRAQRC